MYLLIRVGIGHTGSVVPHITIDKGEDFIYTYRNDFKISSIHIAKSFAFIVSKILGIR